MRFRLCFCVSFFVVFFFFFKQMSNIFIFNFIDDPTFFNQNHASLLPKPPTPSFIRMYMWMLYIVDFSSSFFNCFLSQTSELWKALKYSFKSHKSSFTHHFQINTPPPPTHIYYIYSIPICKQSHKSKCIIEI